MRSALAHPRFGFSVRPLHHFGVPYLVLPAFHLTCGDNFGRHELTCTAISWMPFPEVQRRILWPFTPVPLHRKQ